MSRKPDRIEHHYQLTEAEVHEALRAYLGIPQEQVSQIDLDGSVDLIVRPN